MQGWNETENGRFLFDADSARAVMAAYKRHGVDRMIDLEHLSLDDQAPNFDPDARGWFKLELRADGSLWAVDVRWTADGARRLAEKTQRYVSPAFLADPKTKRVSKIINTAITAMPATHDTPALVAASLVRNSMPDESAIKAAIAAIKEGDGEGALAVLEAMLIAAAAPPADAAAEAPPADPEAMAAPPPAPAPEEPEEDEEKQAAMAARVKLCALSGRETVGEALADVELWRAAYLNQAAERASVAKSHAQLEADERRGLIAQLVRLGSETPATAWENPLAKTLKACKRLASEPIAELRDRVAKLSAARPETRQTITPPNAGGSAELTPRELAKCKAKGIDPAKYARTKAAMAARSEVK